MFKNHAKSRPSFFLILNIKKYEIKGKIFCKKLVEFKIDFGYHKDFKINVTELETCFNHNRKLRIKNNFKLNNKKLNFIFKSLKFLEHPVLNNTVTTKKISNFMKRLQILKSLKNSLRSENVIVGRLIKSNRSGFTVSFAGLFMFVPRIHFFSYRQTNKKSIHQADTFPFKVISIKCLKNTYKGIYHLSVILSRKQANVKIVNYNKRINPKRIESLNKLGAIRF
jgi:ribosomal protein S1